MGKRILVSIETENNIFVSLVFFFKQKNLKFCILYQQFLVYLTLLLLLLV